MNVETVGHYSYHQAIRDQSGIPIDDAEQKKAAEAALEDKVVKRTLIVQWNRDGVTQQLFKAIDTEINGLETLAREKACGYHVTQNHLEIISLLVRSAELRKLKETYAS